MFDDPSWLNLQEKSHWRLAHEVEHLRSLLRSFSAPFYNGYTDAIYGALSRSDDKEYLRGYGEGVKMFELDGIVSRKSEDAVRQKEIDLECVLKRGYEISKYALIEVRPLEDGRYAVDISRSDNSKTEELFPTAKEAVLRFISLEKEKDL